MNIGSKNPCFKCSESFIYKNRHYPGWDCKRICDEYAQHQKYLEGKRKYEKGQRICSVDELLREDGFVWLWEKPVHISIVISLQLRTVVNYINRGMLFKAKEKETSNGKRSNNTGADSCSETSDLQCDADRVARND